jgi:fructokinase
MMGPVLGLGELLWDLFPTGRVAGGAPFNFAFHAKQAGLQGIPVSRVGNDEPGHTLLDLLGNRGLDTSLVQSDGLFATGSVGVDLVGGSPRYTIHQDVAWDHLAWSPEMESIAGRTSGLCFGTLAQRHPVSRTTIQRLVKAAGAAGAICVLDVNIRQQYFTKDILEESIDIAQWVKLSAEDWPGFAWALGLNPARREDELESLRQRRNLELVAFTDGGEGATLHTPEEIVSVAPLRVEVADTVGAGDAFTAGLLASRLRGLPWERAGKYAAALAAEVVKRPGGAPVIEPEALARLGQI